MPWQVHRLLRPHRQPVKWILLGDAICAKKHADRTKSTQTTAQTSIEDKLHARMTRLLFQSRLILVRRAEDGPTSEGAALYLCPCSGQSRGFLRTGCGPGRHRCGEPRRLEQQLPVLLSRRGFLSCKPIAEAAGCTGGCLPRRDCQQHTLRTGRTADVDRQCGVLSRVGHEGVTRSADLG